jgi:hypothetical protein
MSHLTPLKSKLLVRSRAPNFSCTHYARSNRACTRSALDPGLHHHTWTAHPDLARIARSINSIVYNARNLHTAPNAVAPTAPHSDPLSFAALMI